MAGTLIHLDNLMNRIAKTGTRFFAWFFWLFWLAYCVVEIPEQGFSRFVGDSTKGTTLFLIVTALWLWGTVRYLRRRGLLLKARRSVSRPTIGRFLLINILAPLGVSLIVHALTGSASLTLFSMPVLGYFSVNLEIG